MFLETMCVAIIFIVIQSLLDFYYNSTVCFEE